MKVFAFIAAFLFVSFFGFGQGNCVEETFLNIPANASSYGTRIWTGDDGYQFTATDARTDQSINGRCILVRNGSLSATGIPNGIGSLTITTERIFGSSGSGNLTITINGTNVGTIPYNGTVQTTTLSGINITGTFDIEITTPGNGDRIGIDDLSWTCYSNATPGNTIDVSSISSAPFTVNCTTTTAASGTVNFTSTGAFGATNVYTVQLSDATGDFSTPTDIGSLTSTANTGTISVTIPEGTASGTGYLVRVVSSDPVVEGNVVSSPFEIIQDGPCSASGPCVEESFTNISGTGTVSQYLTRTWVGDNGYSFTTTDSRIDQTTLNGRSVTIRDGMFSGSGITNGIGSLTLTTKREFAGGNGNLTITINGINVGTIPYSATAQTTTLSGIDIAGVFDIEISTPNNGDRISIDDLSWTCYSNATPGNSIDVSSISSVPFTVNCTTATIASGTIDFTSTGTFGATNVYTVQLSDATGDFSTPTDIGSLTSTADTGTISVTIPEGTVSGTGYLVRVVSSDPVVEGNVVSSPFEIIQEEPCSASGTPCVEETFSNIPADASSYGTRIWTGDNGYQFTATDARTDQSINGRCILVRNGSLSATGIPNGVGSLTITTERIFGSTGSGNLTITINGINVGTVPYDGTVQTTTISGINITGTFDIEIITPGNGDRIGIDDLSWTCFATSNTIDVNSISSVPFTVNCATVTGATGTINYTSTGTFHVTNVYTVQLSDASGGFSDPIVIGSLTSDANSGTISITIPEDITSGTGYLVRVVSSNPYLEGSALGTAFEIIQEEPCAGGLPNCSVPVWFEDFESYTNGEANPANLKWTTTAGNCDGEGAPGAENGNYWGVEDGEFRVNDIEGITCCSGAEGESDNIFLTENIDISGITELSLFISSRVAGNVECASCGSGGDYFDAQYSIDGGTWVSFSTICGASSSYTQSDCIDASLGSNLQIRIIVGNQANDENYYFDDIYVCPVSCDVILPVSLVDYYATSFGREVELNWVTESELNNESFTILHSTDGYQFQEIAEIGGAGTSSQRNKYSYIHKRPSNGINYYKLRSKDYDGTAYNKGIVSALVETNGLMYDELLGVALFEVASDFTVYSLEGKLVGEYANTNEVPLAIPGLFFIYDTKQGVSYKVVVP
ncbi:hypothetical protein GCM10009118_25930 [Wandonia haliotis]|uniref:Uncharacterized protein n=1 Tax=Wandonia haliotis TaxID=574963 RepID=A0ABN1MSD4_9FLAO